MDSHQGTTAFLADSGFSGRALAQSVEPFPTQFELPSFPPANGGGGANGFVLSGIDAGDGSGSVSSAGDVNGDGIDDIIIGAPSADPSGNADVGESYAIVDRKIPRCLPNLNIDGVVDDGDITAFVDLFFARDIASDLNDDGILDNGDVITFVSQFLVGC